MNGLMSASHQDESSPTMKTQLIEKQKDEKLKEEKSKGDRLSKKILEKKFVLPPIHAKKPIPKDHRNSYPLTESRKIGWKSTRAKYQLDIYGQGPYSRGLGDLCKVFKWPREGI